jgi:hypothetical protein
MVSFDPRAKTAAGMLVLGAVLVSASALGEGDAHQQALAALQDEIRTAELESGPNAAELIEPLTALGLLYQEKGEPRLASVALHQAVAAVRVNYGLYSLEQAPLIRGLIANAESLGDRSSAWELEQGLLKLAARHPDDLQTARILRDTAERRMDVLARYEAGETPPEVILGCYYGGWSPAQDFGASPTNCTAGSRDTVIRGLAMQARTYYVRAVDIILRNQSFASDDLPTLFIELAKNSFEFGGEKLGRRSLTYLLAYQTWNGESWLGRLETLVQIADWDLLHAVGLNEEDAALAEYARAYELMEEKGIAEDSVREIFAPDAPVILPAFMPNPFAGDGVPRESTGYVDVAFAIDKYGRSRHVRLDQAEGSDREAAKRVEHFVMRSRFRPRLVDSRTADEGRMVVRYAMSE